MSGINLCCCKKTTVNLFYFTSSFSVIKLSYWNDKITLVLQVSIFVN